MLDELARRRPPRHGTGVYEPMPPVFGPASPSPIALVVLRRRRAATASLAVADREDRELRALEQLLDVERLAERLRRAQRRVELGLRAADPDALAGGEPVGLDDARRPRDRERPRGRNAGRLHHVLRERLRALDPRRRRARARRRRCRGGAARRRARRRAAPPARRRRGRRRARRRAARATPGSSARAGMAASRAPRFPGFPGAACSSVSRRAARERPRERVLAPARADDEHLHARESSQPRRRSISAMDAPPYAAAEVEVVRLPGGASERDRVAVEEPLEIRIGGAPVAVTMRTPGHDEELALGFCLSEGLQPRGARAAGRPRREHGRRRRAGFDPARLQRSFYTSSSCGVCGKGALEAVAVEAPRVESAAARAARARRRRCPTGCARRRRRSPRPAGCTRPGSSTRDGALLCAARGRRPAQRVRQGRRLGVPRRACCRSRSTCSASAAGSRSSSCRRRRSPAARSSSPSARRRASRSSSPPTAGSRSAASSAAARANVYTRAVADRALTGVLLVGGASSALRLAEGARAARRRDARRARAGALLGEACDERIAVGKAPTAELPFPVLDDGAECARRSPASSPGCARRARHVRRAAGRHARSSRPARCRARGGVPRRRRPADGPAARRLPRSRRSHWRGERSIAREQARRRVVELDGAARNVNTPRIWSLTRHTTSSWAAFARLAPVRGLRRLSAGQRALDVGAGTGALTAELVRRGGEVAAAEPSPAFVAALRSRSPASMCVRRARRSCRGRTTRSTSRSRSWWSRS